MNSQRQSQHRSHHKNRSYKISKRSIKDDYIDKQVWVIHAAIVDKLLSNPEMIEQVKETLENRRETGKIGYGEYITWLSIIEVSDQPDLFKRAILENSGKMKRYRRKTPLVNILTEEEREKAITNGALGTIDDISVLF